MAIEYLDIPLARPYTDEREVEAVAAVIRSGWVSQGARVQAFERLVANFVGAKHAIATNAATTSLHLALQLSGVGPGDEVICPSFTCMATANAIRHVGGSPLFVEIDPRTFNLDPQAIEPALSPRTRAIMVVHQIGLAADMDAINAIARQHDLIVIEDGATALGGEYKGRQIGGLGAPTAFSFHPRKVITTGEGGMLTTDDDRFAEQARIFRSHGASVSDLVRHQARGVIYAAYPEAGYNFRMTDLQGAMGVEQMAKLGWILARKRQIAAWLDEQISQIDGLIPPYIPEYAVHSYQSYLITLSPRLSISRDDLLRQMAERGVSCRHGIAPMHLEPYYLKLYGRLHLPVTEQVSQRTMFLPIYPAMTEAELKHIIASLKAILAHAH
jgi:dTDP-4-amino-4,6-dideoxygalactose transaminase